jgi:hypothetical protein
MHTVKGSYDSFELSTEVLEVIQAGIDAHRLLDEEDN